MAIEAMKREDGEEGRRDRAGNRTYLCGGCGKYIGELAWEYHKEVCPDRPENKGK